MGAGRVSEMFESVTLTCKSFELVVIDRVQVGVCTYNIQKWLPSSVLAGNHKCNCTESALFFCLFISSTHPHFLLESSTRNVYWYRSIYSYCPYYVSSI